MKKDLFLLVIRDDNINLDNSFFRANLSTTLTIDYMTLFLDKDNEYSC